MAFTALRCCSMYSGEARYRRKVRKIRRSRQVADCRSLLHTACVTVARRQIRTADYSPEARTRLADAVVKARTAAGFMYRTDLRDAAKEADEKLSLRSIQAVERGDPGVGQAVLYAIGRLLPGWNEDTPRVILEGGEIPVADEVPQLRATPAGPWPTDAQIIEMSTDDLAGFALKLKSNAGSQAAEDWLFHALSVRRDATRRNSTLPQLG